MGSVIDFRALSVCAKAEELTVEQMKDLAGDQEMLDKTLAKDIRSRENTHSKRALSPIRLARSSLFGAAQLEKIDIQPSEEILAFRDAIAGAGSFRSLYEAIDDPEKRMELEKLEKLSLDDKERNLVLDLVQSRLSAGLKVEAMAVMVLAYVRVMRSQYSLAARLRLDRM